MSQCRPQCRPNWKLLAIVTLAAALSMGRTVAAAVEPVDGTTGIPMGGVGAGAVKFCPYMGVFAATAGTPIARVSFSRMNDTCFQFYSKRGDNIATSRQLTSVSVNGRFDDDAFFPVETANLGTINDVAIHLTAFSPIDFSNLDRMSCPYAFFSLKLTNTRTTGVDVACALRIGTETEPIGVPGKGLRTSGGIEYAVYGAGSDPAAIVSYGNDSGFLMNGQCDNAPSGRINCTAVNVTLGPRETRTIRFVMAWYNGVQDKPPFQDWYHYLNLGSNSGDFADMGLKNFDALMANAVNLATRMRASNLPEWLKNQTMNSLCNLSNNWIYTKDGRMASAEGSWPCVGTMDQMWHSRQIFIMVCPDMIWHELEYWARTQKEDPPGQIHHDFCIPDIFESMVAWDDRQHQDYRDIDNWVDLNCGFIISFYETYIATADSQRLDYFWPCVRKAGLRILTQAAERSSRRYPGTFSNTESTYDAGGDADAYNSGLAMVAYTILSRLAAIKHDGALKASCDAALPVAEKSFQARWLDPRANNFPYGRIAESILAGQQIGYFLKFNSFFAQASLDYGVSSLAEYYDPVNGLHHPTGTYDEWAEYMMPHMGGLFLQTGRYREWRGLQYDYFKRSFDNRDTVFNNGLGIPEIQPRYPAQSFDGGRQYISYPDLWRNYYEIVGFHRDKVTGELWIEPHIPDEMNHVLRDGLFLSPEGMGSISSTESGAACQNQDLTVKVDAPMAVSRLYVKDLYSANISSVKVNGVERNFSRIGDGYGRRLEINWSGTISPAGITIAVAGDPMPPFTDIRNPFNVIPAASGAPSSGATVRDIDDAGRQTGVAIGASPSSIAFAKVDFSDGADSLQVRAQGPAGARLEARLDSPTGPLLGACSLSGIGDAKGWETAAAHVSGASGVHTLCLAASGGPLTVNWLRFFRSIRPGRFHGAFEQIDAEDYDLMSGKVGLQACTDPTNDTTVDYISNGSFLGFRHVDLGAGAHLFKARIASAANGGNIEVHLDSPTGPLLATCPVKGTGGWDTWATQTCPITGGAANGMHAVYLVFTGGSGVLFNLNWFEFVRTPGA
ncbi:MAG: carbohydrate-binding protein [Chthoniobacteraceae bacterium]|jgi:hypothetical protein